MRQLIIISVLLILLGGCGQKGALYLPDDVKNSSSHAEQAPDVPESAAPADSDKNIPSTP